MQCPRCQHENRPQAKFCEECATPLARTCSNCGTALSPTAKFCPECAHPVATGNEPRFGSPETYTPKHLAEKILTSKAALEGERKQVTVLFADMKGSMELLANRDPEQARKILDPVLELSRDRLGGPGGGLRAYRSERAARRAGRAHRARAQAPSGCPGARVGRARDGRAERALPAGAPPSATVAAGTPRTRPPARAEGPAQGSWWGGSCPELPRRLRVAWRGGL